jgi:hypothetical protein
MLIIWKVTFGHLVEVSHIKNWVEELAKINKEQKKENKKENDEVSFKEAILDGEERVKHYLGYRVLEEIRLKDHFHHIDFDFKPDKRSYCIECHGDMPHGKVKELRAFGNMHASYIACQTCHVRLEGPEETGVFKWYDRTSGEIVPSPVKEGVFPGTYESKIIPFVRVNGELRRIDTQERINFYICEDCHQKEAPVLPFKALGYKERRMDAVVSTEVIGMIKNYTKFYIPRMLHPGIGNGKQGNEPSATDNT